MENTAAEKCLRCKSQFPGATPWLCMSCLKDLVHEILRFQKLSLHEEFFAQKKKAKLNRIQSKSRKAWKRSQLGLLPEGAKQPFI